VAGVLPTTRCVGVVGVSVGVVVDELDDDLDFAAPTAAPAAPGVTVDRVRVNVSPRPSVLNSSTRVLPSAHGRVMVKGTPIGSPAGAFCATMQADRRRAQASDNVDRRIAS